MIQKFSKHLATIVVVSLIVVATLAFTIETEHLSRALHPIRVGLSGAVAVAFWPLTWPIFRGKELDATNWLGGGVVLLALALIASSILALTGNFLGFLTNFGTPFRAILTAAMALSAWMILMAPATTKEAVHITGRWAKYGIIAGIALGIAALFL